MMSVIHNHWARVDQAARRHSGIFVVFELLVMIAFAGFHLALYIHAAGTTSFWTDELAIIAWYSSKGPLVTLTTGGGNNHHFFNLVNSLTPWMNHYNPLRARLWSIIAVVAMLFIVLWFFAGRRRFLEGTLLFQLLAANNPLLDLTLQARG